MKDEVKLEDFSGFVPKFIVASNFPKRIVGEVNINPGGESTVTFKVYNRRASEAISGLDGNEPVFTTTDIAEAIAFYNQM